MNRTQLNALPVAARLYASYRDAQQTDFVTPAYIAVVDGAPTIVFADADGVAPAPVRVADVPDSWLDVTSERVGNLHVTRITPEPSARRDVHLHNTQDAAWQHAVLLKASEMAHVYAQLDAERLGGLLASVQATPLIRPIQKER